MKAGGGFLKSHGLRGGGDLPAAQPMKPMGPLPTAPQGGAPPPQAAPQAPPPQGMPPAAPQGPQQPQPGMNDVNDVANNALLLLHDEQSGPAFDEMISQGPQGAAQALVTIYSLLRQEYEAQGQAIDPDKAVDATEAVIEDVAAIGRARGSIKSQDDIDDFVAMSLSQIAQQYPDVAEDMQAMAAEMPPEAHEQGGAIAARAGGQAPVAPPPPAQGGFIGRAA